MLPSWCTDSVTVSRAQVVTRNGRTQRDWASPTTRVVRGCSLQPSTTETTFDGAQRDASESAATLLCPPGSDIEQGDRVSAGGRTWEVDGVPYAMTSPTGRVSHVRAQLREWRG